MKCLKIAALTLAMSFFSEANAAPIFLEFSLGSIQKTNISNGATSFVQQPANYKALVSFDNTLSWSAGTSNYIGTGTVVISSPVSQYVPENPYGSDKSLAWTDSGVFTNLIKRPGTAEYFLEVIIRTTDFAWKDGSYTNSWNHYSEFDKYINLGTMSDQDVKDFTFTSAKLLELLNLNMTSASPFHFTEQYSLTNNPGQASDGFRWTASAVVDRIDSVPPTNVPEPGTVALVSLGLISFVCVQKRKRYRKQHKLASV